MKGSGKKYKRKARYMEKKVSLSYILRLEFSSIRIVFSLLLVYTIYSYKMNTLEILELVLLNKASGGFRGLDMCNNNYCHALNE